MPQRQRDISESPDLKDGPDKRGSGSFPGATQDAPGGGQEGRGRGRPGRRAQGCHSDPLSCAPMGSPSTASLAAVPVPGAGGAAVLLWQPRRLSPGGTQAGGQCCLTCVRSNQQLP